MKRNIRGLIISIMLILALGSVSVCVFAEDGNSTGLFKPQGDEFVISKSIGEDGSAQGFKKASLPAKYDARTLPYASLVKVKNQNPTGMCWACAAATCSERSWLQEMVNNGKSPTATNLSAMHLGYFLYHKQPDYLGNNIGDENLISRAGYNWKNVGGNNLMAIQTMAQGVGMASESLVPFNANTSYINPSYSYNNTLTIENGVFLYSDEAAKEAIMKYGAVAADYYSNENYRANDGKSYYCNLNTSSNHAITIVGWDDNYRASNFAGSAAGTPSINGAWIIQNSWGASSGESGYYYISYADTTLCDPCYYDMQPADTYDYIYQYDGNATSSRTSFDKGEKYVNFYTANGAPSEVLEAVGFVNMNSSADTFYYTVDIYKDAYKTSDITNSKKVASFNVTTSGKGYNTFTLPEGKEVELTRGTGFAVSITFNSCSSGATKSWLGYEQNDNSNGFVNFVASNSSGKSYWYGGNWYDLSQNGNGCARIKALTVTKNGSDTDPETTPEDELFDGYRAIRTAGANRYETSTYLADNMYVLNGDKKFDCIVVACGSNFPDALSGGYLAYVNNAPLITVDDAHQTSVYNYIRSTLNSGGKVYILGGTGAVSEGFESMLRNGVTSKVYRLAGPTRYDTNIEILREAGVDDEELLVCSGTGFADALSASALKRPIFLVGSDLTAAQKDYLACLEGDKGYVIGGTGAVSDKVKTQVFNAHNGYIDLERVAGANRYATSIAIAEKFFPGNTLDVMVLTYGQNFPDGLSGGPVAMKLNAPLILAENAVMGPATTFGRSRNVGRILVIGGESLISDSAVLGILR